MSLMLSRRTKLGAGAGFSPDQIAGLQLWLKADSLSLADGDPVATWADSSVNANNATQTTAAKRPVYKTAIVNGKPVVRFDGVDDQLEVANNPAAIVTFSMFVVRSMRVDQFSRTYFGSFNPDTGGGSILGVGDNSANQNKTKFYTEPGNTQLSAALPITTFAIFCGTYGSGNKNLYHNGTNVATNTALADPTFGAVSRTTVGALPQPTGSGAQFFDGDFPEVILYNSVLSTADRQSVETHLKEKYGIA